MNSSETRVPGRLNVRHSRSGLVFRDDWYVNLVTDAGDLYYANMVIAGVSPAAPAAPTKANGMKLGTGNTAIAKNGSGAALSAYLTASNQAFDAGFPQTLNLGAGLGVEAVYEVTYQPGVATSATIYEAAIVTNSTVNTASTAASTVSRIVFITPYNKGPGDTLSLIWYHKFLGQ